MACRFCASNLDPQVKDSVKGLVKLLGGQYTIKMGHRNTHLVVPFAAGDKYRGAMRFEVAPITYKWLIDVAKSGKQPACISAVKSEWTGGRGEMGVNK